MKNRVLVLHGINLGALERRPAAHYGGLTYTQLEHRIARLESLVGIDDVTRAGLTLGIGLSGAVADRGDDALEHGRRHV